MRRFLEVFPRTSCRKLRLVTLFGALALMSGWAVACVRNCYESATVCDGIEWEDPLYGRGWQVTSEEYDPCIAAMLWTPSSYTASPDNFFQGNHRSYVQFVPEGYGWPCACSVSETPTTGGLSIPSSTQWYEQYYYQYCNTDQT